MMAVEVNKATLQALLVCSISNLHCLMLHKLLHISIFLHFKLTLETLLDYYFIVTLCLQTDKTWLNAS